MTPLESVNPATGALIERYVELAPARVEEAVAASAEAYRAWRLVPFSTRVRALDNFADALAGARDELADLLTREVGKLRTEALAEVDKCVLSTRQLTEHLPRWRAEREYRVPQAATIHLEPLGPLLGIMPWNFPLWQVVRFAVPALLGGNTILLKHAPNTWGASRRLGELFGASLPPGVYQDLRIGVGTAEKVITDRRVRGVSLTGSKRAGQAVGALAGRHLKTCVLELGGSDAYLILDDADVGPAAKVCAAARLINAGQSCVAAKRFIVGPKNAEAFIEAFRAELGDAVMGDPIDPATKLAPMARRDLRDELAAQVKRSVAAGARLELGGEVPSTPGFYYPATLLTRVRPGMAAFDEELFGPVASVTVGLDEADLFRLANQSIYGLGGAIFSRDPSRARELARTSMECGMVAINQSVRSAALIPFGGIKDSGVGRELGREGAFAFVNVKTITN